MITFLIGVAVGAMLGVLLMCVLISSAQADADAQRIMRP